MALKEFNHIEKVLIFHFASTMKLSAAIEKFKAFREDLIQDDDYERWLSETQWYFDNTISVNYDQDRKYLEEMRRGEGLWQKQG